MTCISFLKRLVITDFPVTTFYQEYYESRSQNRKEGRKTITIVIRNSKEF